MPAYRLANAPCSWGVDFADRPENPDWRRVLDEAAAAGFSAIDLGPVGYFPPDPSQLADELVRRNLSLSAGGLFDPLADPAAFDGVIGKTRRTCAILKALNAPRLVIIDCVSEARGDTAGRSSAARRLSPTEWKDMIGRIVELARIAWNEYGVTSTLHAHAGTNIEFEDELDRAMADAPENLLGLCVDTGHSAYAGIDPVKLIHKYGKRIGHMHLKDVDPQVRASCLAGEIDFFGAIAKGIFCPLGRGMVEFAAVRDALAEIGYGGVAVVEQDVDPSSGSGPRENARQSYAFLKRIEMTPSEGLRA